ncbi:MULTISPECIES: GNAT family N-acetyltransferase [unclassified Rhizobium]|uniref:GNAT family N-acetyltransferase n=1 Tax=Rhizobium TaxID=379 RepID=UPI00084CE304|nr:MULTISPECIES: GNAT family N-acetyltransferase [unclassified Rhizobium]OEC92903.1 GNAT family acetyltransferase [Rhizobium sp. YK2]QYA12512.1 GNAT family N-acetyltransferase [Rhizobium sp. AB2/73]UEQ81557.1 GNAT family N-acetyltransferase [Rhizobium sp. AB2/73]
MTLPNFETERLILIPRTMADLDDCIAMDRDPEVTRFIPGPWQDVDAHRTFVKSRIEANFGDGLGYWSIRAKENLKQFLGWILLIPADAIGPDIEIGWRLNRLAWSKGYATEAARPVLAHAFQTLELDRVIADIAPGNAASIRVAQKLGLSQPRETTYHDEPFASYSMTRATFEAELTRQ